MSPEAGASPTSDSAEARLLDPVIWSDVENGAYAGDLALWEQLARAAAGPVLEIGCGSGRVALRLGRLGIEVVGVDVNGLLVEAVNSRAGDEGLPVQAVKGDATRLELERQFGLVIAPMQVAHQLPSAEHRAAMVAAIARHLAPAGEAAFAVLDADAVRAASYEGDFDLVPDMLERDGWVYSSQPLSVRPLDGGLEVVRRRQAVSPDGALTDRTEREWLAEVEPEELEAVGASSGLTVRERVPIPATDDHVGSIVVRLAS